MPCFPLASESLQRLESLFAAATKHASQSVGRWTQGKASLTLDGMLSAPLDQLAAKLGMDDQPLTMVVLGIDGDPGGQIILAFEDAAGRALAAALVRRQPSGDGDWSELERSAVMETGNILASAYLSEMSRSAGRLLSPTPPYFACDFGGSVLEQALLVQALDQDEAIVCRTRFTLEHKEIAWSVLCIPSQELLASLISCDASSPAPAVSGL